MHFRSEFLPYCLSVHAGRCASVRPCVQALLHDLQAQEHNARKNWAAIGEARSSSDDDKHERSHHDSGGVDTSIHMLREKNRFASCSNSCSARAMMLAMHLLTALYLQTTLGSFTVVPSLAGTPVIVGHQPYLNVQHNHSNMPEGPLVALQAGTEEVPGETEAEAGRQRGAGLGSQTGAGAAADRQEPAGDP